ncbi:uncharacterized protein BDFB_000090 [Asbolus verrucosus]|uniref:Uncharacterized protein n=1 Tax=Asbolus verrucosus TaxID=1661398 RepID=A0A482VFU2_ASBVE|nr:uncharacterized protein BDFB_000090 [Asbolus verrucosus]
MSSLHPSPAPQRRDAWWRFGADIKKSSAGYCIQCYSCVSKDHDACFKFDKSKIALRKCDMTELKNTKRYAETIGSSISTLFEVDIGSQEPQVPMNCLKQVTKVGGKEVVLRGCQLAATDKLDICVKMKKVAHDTIHTSYCSLCNSDGCNVASSLQPPFFALTFVVVFRLLTYC